MLDSFSFQSRRSLSGAGSEDVADLRRQWWKDFLLGSRSHVGAPEPQGPPIRIVDLFSSVGGLSLGVDEACRAMGFSPIHDVAVDVDEAALGVYACNFPGTRVHRGSVRDLVESRVRGFGESARFAFTPEAASEVLNAARGIDILVAGPPCQGHSTLNNHSRGEDPRNQLYLTVPAIAVATGARTVIIENVPNVVNASEGVVASTRALLRDAGYHLSEYVLRADRLGWAQTRRRFFLVASRDATHVELGAVASALEAPAASLEWAIGDLLEQPAHAIDRGSLMLTSPQLSEENRKRISYLFENDAYDLPNAVRPQCHRDGTTYKAVYGRMRWEDPAPTLTTGFMSPGRGRFVHPLEPRTLTPREVARLQGFPDWFKFDPEGTQLTRSLLAKWLGDAVPSIMGYAAGLAALSALVR